MLLAAYGPHIDDIPADDPRLQGALAATEASLAWVERYARKEPRPHRSVFEDGSPQEEMRDRVGPASFDAVALGETDVGPVYADDLGLRRLSVGLGPVPEPSPRPPWLKHSPPPATSRQMIAIDSWWIWSSPGTPSFDLPNTYWRRHCAACLVWAPMGS